MSAFSNKTFRIPSIHRTLKFKQVDIKIYANITINFMSAFKRSL